MPKRGRQRLRKVSRQLLKKLVNGQVVYLIAIQQCECDSVCVKFSAALGPRGNCGSNPLILRGGYQLLSENGMKNILSLPI